MDGGEEQVWLELVSRGLHQGDIQLLEDQGQVRRQRHRGQRGEAAAQRVRVRLPAEEFAGKFGEVDTEFSCYYSQVDPERVITHLDYDEVRKYFEPRKYF